MVEGNVKHYLYFKIIIDIFGRGIVIQPLEEKRIHVLLLNINQQKK